MIGATIKIGSTKMVQVTQEEMRVLERIYPVIGDLSVMLDGGVFDFKRGRAVIHRDETGQLRKIEVELTRWSK